MAFYQGIVEKDAPISKETKRLTERWIKEIKPAQLVQPYVGNAALTKSALRTIKNGEGGTIFMQGIELLFLLDDKILGALKDAAESKNTELFAILCKNDYVNKYTCDHLKDIGATVYEVERGNLVVPYAHSQFSNCVEDTLFSATPGDLSSSPVKYRLTYNFAHQPSCSNMVHQHAGFTFEYDERSDDLDNKLGSTLLHKGFMNISQAATNRSISCDVESLFNNTYLLLNKHNFDKPAGKKLWIFFSGGGTTTLAFKKYSSVTNYVESLLQAKGSYKYPHMGCWPSRDRVAYRGSSTKLF